MVNPESHVHVVFCVLVAFREGRWQFVKQNQYYADTIVSYSCVTLAVRVYCDGKPMR